jgi:hypothetical protein
MCYLIAFCDVMKKLQGISKVANCMSQIKSKYRVRALEAREVFSGYGDLWVGMFFSN